MFADAIKQFGKPDVTRARGRKIGMYMVGRYEVGETNSDKGGEFDPRTKSTIDPIVGERIESKK
jgi:hypothetical protein